MPEEINDMINSIHDFDNTIFDHGDSSKGLNLYPKYDCRSRQQKLCVTQDQHNQ